MTTPPDTHRAGTAARSGPAPQAVTGAQRSRPEEIDARRTRYLWTMGIRAVLFCLSVFLFHGVLRWSGLVVAGVTPYVAVVLANGGPRRTKDTSTYVVAAPDDTLRLEPGRTIEG